MKKALLIILGFVSLTVIASGMAVYSRWCSRVSGVSVLKNNTPLENATVCRCREDILILTGDGIGLLIVDLNKRVVGYGNEGQFDKTSLGWFSQSWPINYVAYDESGKVDADPQLEIGDKHIYFQANFSYSVSATFEDSLR